MEVRVAPHRRRRRDLILWRPCRFMKGPPRKRRRIRASAAGGGDTPLDRISDLPDDLLGAILTFLPFKEAARTAVLSSRWRHVWLHFSPIHSLDLASLCPQEKPIPKGLIDLLARHRAPARRVLINEDSLMYSALRSKDSPESLYETLRHKCIQEIIFEGYRNWQYRRHFAKEICTLPHYLIAWGSVSSLALRRCRFGDLGLAMRCLTSLKELRLSELHIVDDSIAASPFRVLAKDLSTLISNLPKLVDLHLNKLDIASQLSLHSKSLQSLNLNYCFQAKGLNIDAPNLLDLHMSGAQCMHNKQEGSPNMHSAGLPQFYTLELRSINCEIHFQLRSRTLQHMKIFDGSFKEISIIDAPNLHAAIFYLPRSKPHLQLRVIHAPNLQTMAYQCNERTLVGCDLLESLEDMDATPNNPFRSIKKLFMIMCWQPRVLKYFPSLETLCITVLFHNPCMYSGIYKMLEETQDISGPQFLNHLKRIHIRTLYFCRRKIRLKSFIKLVRILVTRARNLERIQIQPNCRNERLVSHLKKELAHEVLVTESDACEVCGPHGYGNLGPMGDDNLHLYFDYYCFNGCKCTIGSNSGRKWFRDMKDG